MTQQNAPIHKSGCPALWTPDNDGYTGSYSFECTCGAQQNAPTKCPRCNSSRKEVTVEPGCYPEKKHGWHCEPAAPPEGETMIDHGFAAHTSGVKCSLCDKLKQQEAVASPAMNTESGVVFVGEVFDCSARSVVEESCVCKAGWGHRSFDVNAAALTTEKDAELARMRHQYSPRCEAHVGEKFDDCPCCEGAEVARLREQVEVLKRERQWNFDHGFNQ